MKRFFLILVILLLAGCKPGIPTNHAELEVVALAKAQHKCDNVKIVSEGFGWHVLNVCGVKRFYEYGRWCESCSVTWRERKKAE